MAKRKAKPRAWRPGIDADADELLRRAFAAWFRTGGTDQPANTSEVVKHEGLEYVVLWGGSGADPLAVYRVRNNGMLRRLKRWPLGLTEWERHFS